MAIFKCKMCGGDLNIVEGVTVAECEYCGSTQTVPGADNEKKMTLFARANRLRAGCEFDKAAGVYETIVADFPEEAEAYWGLVLCKYGIEYVDDPATGKKIPTCHRSSFNSVLEDSDFEQACENADAYARRIYRDEAKAIENLRRGIIAVSANEQPYDIFICYKETAENGERTLDSVLAQEIYDALTGKSYRVFFSRITLEDKLGVEYEPYIFAALNSAKIMLAVGTDYEYYNAVWVKNEWSRYLKLMEQDKGKHLIPCFKGLDAYDMPKEFARLQAQDMGKVGAMQDLLRGIDKLVGKNGTDGAATPTSASNPTVDSLLKRVFMYLEDDDWSSANEYCEKVLDIDPENARAYLGKLMAELHMRKQEQLREQTKPFDDNKNYQKALRFADNTLKGELVECMKHITYSSANISMIKAKTTRDYSKAAELFGSIRDYLDAADLEKSCREKVEARGNAHKELIQKWMQEKNYTRTIFAERDLTIAIRSDGTVVVAGDKKDGLYNVPDWTDIVSIGTCEDCMVGLRSDGTLVVTNNGFSEYNLSEWTDIVSIDTGEDDMVGLRSDGTVVATYGLYNVSDWTDIVTICRSDILFGLRADGTVVVTGWDIDDQRDVCNWTDIVSVVISRHTIGLRSDGTVVTTGDSGDGRYDVSDWTDIVSVVSGSSHVIGLKSDGTVVATGWNYYGQCNVSGWTNIMSVVAGGDYTIGLRADGTVVATGRNEYGQCNVSGWGWTNIMSVVTGGDYTIGLRSDGTVVATGRNEYGQCNVSDWTDIAIPNTAVTTKIRDTLYNDSKRVFTGEVSDTMWNWETAQYGFEALPGWRDADSLAQQCAEKVRAYAEEERIAAEAAKAAEEKARREREAEERETRYQNLLQLIDGNPAKWQLVQAVDGLRALNGYRDSATLIARCLKCIDEMKAEERRQLEAQIAKLRREQTELQTELANLRGFFTGKRRKEIEARLVEIKREIERNMG